MADAYLKVKDNGASGLELVRESVGDAEDSLGVTDLKTQIDDIQPDVFDLNMATLHSFGMTATFGEYNGTTFVSSTNRAYYYGKTNGLGKVGVKSGYQFSVAVKDSPIPGAFSYLFTGWSSDDTDLTAYQNKYLLITGRKNDNSALSEESLSKMFVFYPSENLVDAVSEEVSILSDATNQLTNIVGCKWDEGHFISGTGAYSPAVDRACTDFIPCEPFVSLTYVGENDHSNVCGISFYDKYYDFISGDKNSGTIGNPTTVTSPGKTAFLRVSTKLSLLSDSYVKYNGQKNSALFAVATNSLNRVVYVDTENGNDTNNGNRENPFKTLSHALATGAEEIGITPNSIITEAISINYGRIHLFGVANYWAVDGSIPYRARAKFNGGESIQTILTIQNAQKVVIEDIELYNCTGDGCLINKCDSVELTNCSFYDNGNNGIVINYTNGVFRRCTAYNNGHDGFNLNYYGETQFYNCSGWGNGDDGISHHQGTTGLIDGGEWYDNVKGGVSSPCYGARVDIYNVYSHDNGYGIYAWSNGQSDGRNFKIWNCVCNNNSYYGISCKYNTPTLYHTKIAGNTTGQSTGNGTVNFVILD
jgi:hypothetical protein